MMDEFVAVFAESHEIFRLISAAFTDWLNVMDLKLAIINREEHAMDVLKCVECSAFLTSEVIPV